MPEADDLKAAKAGDGAAFDRLTRDAAPRIRAILRRVLGRDGDVDDVLQETLIAAHKALPSFRGEAAFSTWLTSIATRKAIDHLRAARRWRKEAMVAHANLCAADETLSGEVVSAFSAPDAAFELRQHVGYCFTCVGRSLPPDEQAALVLREVMEMPAREAAAVLGVSESVLRHRLAAAREGMKTRYEDLCALVNKQGICHQCSGLSQVARGFGGEPGPLPDVAELASRMAIVREMRDQPSSAIHALLFDQLTAVEAAGAGSAEAESGCGEEDPEAKQAAG